MGVALHNQSTLTSMEDEASSMFLLASDSCNNTHTDTLSDKVKVLNEHRQAHVSTNKIAQATLNIEACRFFQRDTGTHTAEGESRVYMQTQPRPASWQAHCKIRQASDL